ncbi:MAG: Xaa-Pro peptidase family protein [Candidatus Pacebacteria bacterium]|jgi:Xaa-Pro aminopeptidase|nr:Xaa-Pro peptidase family protein [Candidatus Paceibacterota bacterium]
MSETIAKFQYYIGKEKLGGFIVTDAANIFYLTGIANFDTEKGFILIVTKNNWRVISSIFYQSRIDGKVPPEKVAYVPRGESISENAAKNTKEGTDIGFERDDISFSYYEVLKKSFRKRKLVPISNAIEQLRKVKNDAEIALIKKAVAITDKTFAELVKITKPGVTEFWLKRKSEEIMQDLGAQGCSFPSIIAAGKGGADPHYEGSNRKIRAGEMIVFDIGARYKNYDADMTRMVFVGKATAKYKQLYQAVLEVQEKALKNCVIGADTKTIYDNCVANLKDHDLDQYFTHGLGHGVGIDIHELPNLNAGGTDKLENGMVFTIEPGIYLSGWGGIRIEDLCVMQNGKCVILSKTPKNLIEINV